jgi:hypothetical protein
MTVTVKIHHYRRHWLLLENLMEQDRGEETKMATPHIHRPTTNKLHEQHLLAVSIQRNLCEYGTVEKCTHYRASRLDSNDDFAVTNVLLDQIHWSSLYAYQS